MILNVRELLLDDIESYVSHVRETNLESGRDGMLIFHPYSRHEPYDAEEALARERKRWATPLAELGWRRAWGLFADDGQDPIGHIYLEGGTLTSEMHRVGLGMGLRRAYHRKEGGALLLDTAIAWAQNQPQIAWIDLGVFVGNDVAARLYESRGFIETGRIFDRFRVDGHQIDDISMSLPVGPN